MVRKTAIPRMTWRKGLPTLPGQRGGFRQESGRTGVTAARHESYDGAWFCCAACAAFARTGAKYGWFIAS